MKLLFITQKVDAHDRGPLAFVSSWIRALAMRVEHLEVICLEKGTVHLPDHVDVWSLGKESGKSRFHYMRLFFKYIYTRRKKYDAVLVHMNQEYVLLGAFVWRMLGKRVVLWYNHTYGSIRTRLAVLFSHRVLYTSQHAYTARFKKSLRAPAGIDTEVFCKKKSLHVGERVILSVGRLSKVKNLHTLIDAFNMAYSKCPHAVLHIYGEVADADYFEELQARVKTAPNPDRIRFLGGVRYEDMAGVYNTGDVFVNLTQTGSFDKTVLEAMACEVPVILSNQSFFSLYTPEMRHNLCFEEADAKGLATAIMRWYHGDAKRFSSYGRLLRSEVVEHHGLNRTVSLMLDACFQ